MTSLSLPVFFRASLLLAFFTVVFPGARPAPALVNPSLQPGNLVERYKSVAALEVAGFDEAAHTYTFKVTGVLTGEFAPKSIAFQLPAADDGGEEEALILNDGDPVIAFISKSGRRGADEVALYVGNREWYEARMADPAAPDKWTLTAKSPEAMSGTFNGDPSMLEKMLREIAAGVYYFPPLAATKFSDDVVIAEFKGPIAGVGLYELNGDGKLDVMAGTPEGVKVYFQKADAMEFDDVTARLGLEGVTASSISIADVNGDGAADLLLDTTIYLAKDGKFEKSDLLTAATAEGLQASAFAEINGDGRPDVVVSLKKGGLHLYFNPEAGGAFADATQTAGLLEEGANPKGTGYFAVGDWTGDGRSDLFYGAGKALILEQDEAGRFSPAPGRLNIDLRDSNDFAEGLTGDGVFAPLWEPDRFDLAIPTDSRMALLTRDDGKPRDVSGLGNEIGVAPAGLWGTVAEDLNADGRVDLYSISRLPEGGSNVLHLNRGYGSFMFPERYGAVMTGKSYTTGAGGAAAGDVNGDGANDLLLGGLDGRLLLSINDSLSLRQAKDHPTYHESKLLATRIITLTPKGQRGL